MKEKEEVVLKALVKNNMMRFLSVILFFLLAGCGERHCIRPHDIGVRETLSVVSTQQKWVDSGIEISGKTKVTEIEIIARNLNFCAKEDVTSMDYLVRSGVQTVQLPFELKKGDMINFSVVPNKICKNKDDESERNIDFDKTCSEKEIAYFAKVLNQENCDDKKCPNKYVPQSGSKSLKGREYWPERLAEDEIKKIKEEIKNYLEKDKSLDCNKLNKLIYTVSEIDTYLLNLICKDQQVESLAQWKKLSDYIKVAWDDQNGLNEAKLADAVKKFSQENQAETYIPLLKVSIPGENFDHIGGGIKTNYDYKIGQYHAKGENLNFTLGDGRGTGGYKIKVQKVINTDERLYIYIGNTIPTSDPGEGDQTNYIPIDISKIYDYGYTTDLVKGLSGKVGKIYYGVRSYGCEHKDNQGEFSISITTKDPPIRTFSAIYNFFDTGVKQAFFGANYKSSGESIDRGDSPTRMLYESFVKSNRTNTIRSTIIALLMLYIVLYTFYYFLGLSHSSIYEFLIICLKVGIIVQLLRDNSWNFFYNNGFTLFVNGTNQLIEIANFRGVDQNNTFEFLDLPLNRFLSAQSILLIVSLIFSGPLGIIAFCLIIWGFITITIAIFNTLFSFVTSIAVIALLLSLAPLFIICVLFKYTRQMFFKWVGYLARFAVYPAILLIFISLISSVMDHIIYSLFSFEVCSTCILPIDLKVFTPCLFSYYAATQTPNIHYVIAFIIVGNMMKACLEAASTISDTLFSSYTSNEPGKEYKQSLLGVVGLDDNSVAQRKYAASQQAGTQGPKFEGPKEPKPQIPQRPQAPNEK